MQKLKPWLYSYMTRRDVVYIISVCRYNLGQVLIELPGNQRLFSKSIMNKAINFVCALCTGCNNSALSSINTTVQKPAYDSYEDGGVLLHTTLLILQFTVMFRFSLSTWGGPTGEASGFFLRCTSEITDVA